MNVSEINEGQKATWTIDGNELTVNVVDKSITLDLDAAQKDTVQIITISLDAQVQLQIDEGKWHVASVIIPNLKMHLVDTGQVDEFGNPKMIQEALPINTDEVSLVLWALPTFLIEGGGIL